MNVPWYESQLVGVIVGAVLRFISSFLPRYIDQRRKRGVLRAALSVEDQYAARRIQELQRTDRSCAGCGLSDRRNRAIARNDQGRYPTRERRIRQVTALVGVR